jgi:hypothetical protein
LDYYRPSDISNFETITYRDIESMDVGVKYNRFKNEVRLPNPDIYTRQIKSLQNKLLLLVSAGCWIWIDNLRNPKDMVEGLLICLKRNSAEPNLYKKLGQCTDAELFVLLDKPHLWKNYQPSMCVHEDIFKTFLFLTWDRIKQGLVKNPQLLKEE